MRTLTRVGQRAAQTSWLIPSFLCPALLLKAPLASTSPTRPVFPFRLKTRKLQYRCLHIEATHGSPEVPPRRQQELSFLPWTCPGCGAYTQTQNIDNAGFYSTTRNAVKSFLSARKRIARGHSPIEGDKLDGLIKDENTSAINTPDEEIFKDNAETILAGEDHHANADTLAEPLTNRLPNIPVCDRCHHLLHHHKGVSIVHPSVKSIEEIIADSPYKYNHVYHILDAADFPLSLIPHLQNHLSLTPQRSQNRRAKTSNYHQGRKAKMTFVITRSDLLAPTKAQVDSMMPYLLQVLRDALGSSGKDVRLGNVRCVSSERGWWTKQVKEDIWERGGCGWMVGKVNVGKSSLFETVFPKGRNMDINFNQLRAENAGSREVAIGNPVSHQQGPYMSETFNQKGLPVKDSPLLEGTEELHGDSLLPPAPAELAFPVMPVVSALPGTTASPIRLPFGRGRGELIDLPGLDRGGLERYVSNEHKIDLVMRRRVKAEQYPIRPGDSILIGGLIRITPLDPDTVLLACPFVPFGSHVTNTTKAIAVHTQASPSGILTITTAGAGEKMASAGIFQLKWDVTKQRAGPLTASTAVGLNPRVLPFIVYSADILIEGCGWVELAVQVRKKAMQASSEDLQSAGGSQYFPSVEVFSPQGKHIGIRRPMGAWVLGGHHPAKARPGHARPRRSMKGVKKNLKKLARAK